MEPKLLEKIGLTHNESKVYLSLLKLGTSKTGEILKSSGLNSGKIYEILESLKIKGLVSESKINNVKFFSASPTFKILEYLEKKKEDIEKDEDIIKKELPNLEKIRGSSTKESNAKTYVGFNGFKTAVYEAFNSLKEGDEILGMGVTGKKEKKFNEFWLNFGEERVRRKIKAKNLFSDKSDYLKEYKKFKLTENRVLEGITPVTIDIFGDDKVLILNYNEPYSCILIHDKNTANSFKSFFDELWKSAKK